MLPGGEDLLQQLSSELGLPEFLDDVTVGKDEDLKRREELSKTIFAQFMSADSPSVIKSSSHLPQNDGMTWCPLTIDAAAKGPTFRTLECGSQHINPDEWDKVYPNLVSPSVKDQDSLMESMDLTTNRFAPSLHSLPPSPATSDSSLSSSSSSERKNVEDTDRCSVRNQVSSNPPVIVVVTSSSQVVGIPPIHSTPAPAKVTQSNFKIAIPKLVKLASEAKVSSKLSAPATHHLSSQPLVVFKTKPASGVIKTEPFTRQNVERLPFVDVKSLKKQQRMIKNRESAYLSRKKKREYLTGLEERVEELSKENSDLKRENRCLKTKLQELSAQMAAATACLSEGRKLAGSAFTQSAAKTRPLKGTVLLALLCVVSLNLSNLGIYNSNQVAYDSSLEVGAESSANKIISLHRSGRSLLWVQDESEEEGSESSSVSRLCSMNLNLSESLRLESELRGWFQEDLNFVGNSSSFSRSKRKSRTKRRIGSFDLWLGGKKQSSFTGGGEPGGFVGGRRRHTRVTVGNLYMNMLLSHGDDYQRDVIENNDFNTRKIPSDGGGEVALYDVSTDSRFESFFEAIDRREDTFYVVSFPGENHILLPAAVASTNQSSRPRMSLLLPSSVSLNESMRSSQPGQVAMMKIDCDVTNTRLLHLNQDIFPSPSSHQHTTNNQSGGQSTRNRSSFYYHRKQSAKTADGIKINATYHDKLGGPTN